MPYRAALLAALGLIACGKSPGIAGDAHGATDGGLETPPDAGGALDAPPSSGPALPDLQFDTARMTDAWVVTNDLFLDHGDCAVIEGCVDQSGRRTLLRFDTITANLGTADLVMGAPPPPGVSNDVFEWSPCHMHHHVRNYASYELLDDTGTVLTARKQSFCLEDGEQVKAGAQPHGYSCVDQGISRGWADVYARGLPCQWIDVTDLAHGTYTLRITVNPLHVIQETDTTNNVFTTTVSF